MTITKDHWRKIGSYPERWNWRAEMAVKFVAPGANVLDVGCGRMAVRDLLPEGCRYTPADLEQWTPDTIQIDFDEGLFPVEGPYDYCFALGVMEYVAGYDWAFREIARVAEHFITSFCHPVSPVPVETRRKAGWINDFSRDEYIAAVVAGGWTLREDLLGQEQSQFTQRVYLFAKG